MEQYVTDEIDDLLKRAGDLTKEAERLASEPQDDFPIGSILTWTRGFEQGRLGYAYAALKYTSVHWATTGNTGKNMSWRQLWRNHLSHANPGSVYYATELTQEEMP